MSVTLIGNAHVRIRRSRCPSRHRWCWRSRLCVSQAREVQAARRPGRRTGRRTGLPRHLPAGTGRSRRTRPAESSDSFPVRPVTRTRAVSRPATAMPSASSAASKPKAKYCDCQEVLVESCWAALRSASRLASGSSQGMPGSSAPLRLTSSRSGKPDDRHSRAPIAAPAEWPITTSGMKSSSRSSRATASAMPGSDSCNDAIPFDGIEVNA